LRPTPEALKLLAKLEVQLGWHHVDLVQLVQRRRTLPNATLHPSAAARARGHRGEMESERRRISSLLLRWIWTVERQNEVERTERPACATAPPGRNLETWQFCVTPPHDYGYYALSFFFDKLHNMILGARTDCTVIRIYLKKNQAV
jgi:hypothetical protein